MHEQTELGVPPTRLVRPERWQVYMKMAKEIGERSTCRRGRVGAIITDLEGIILATGYNGSPPGMPHCIDHGCVMDPKGNHCIATLHAEMNAIVRMERTPHYGICYCTYSPCLSCLKVGLAKNIFKWVYQSHYEDKSRDMYISWYNHHRKYKEYMIDTHQVRWDDEIKSFVE